MKKLIYIAVICLIAGNALQDWVIAQTSMIGTMPTRRQEEGATRTLGSMSFIAQQPVAPKVFREHDLVTVIVNKSWVSSNKGAMERKKRMNTEYGISKWVSFNGLFNIGASKLEDGAPAIGGKIDSKFKNEGSTVRREQLEFKITCQVESIQENGVLYIEGTDKDMLAEDGKIIELTGYVRPQDIQPDNTIKGDLVYLREIREIPSGPAYDSYRRGWGQQLVDRYSPF
jgi:flagellar L-ring protein precursor FlgH